MASESLSENPYVSPACSFNETIEAEAAEGVTWDSGRVTIDFSPTVDDYVDAALFSELIDVGKP